MRGLLLAWTMLTTTFVWTSTMRLLLKPEVSEWRILGLSGAGADGPYWVLPSIAAAALVLFYAAGRSRLQPLFHGLLLAWHVTVAGVLLYACARYGSASSFTGAAWGVSIPLWVLAVPFTAFAALSVRLVVRERRGRAPDLQPGKGVHLGKLASAALLLPVAYALFRAGDGYDVLVKAAIVVTILQWILLAEAMGPAGAKARVSGEEVVA